MPSAGTQCSWYLDGEQLSEADKARGKGKDAEANYTACLAAVEHPIGDPNDDKGNLTDAEVAALSPAPPPRPTQRVGAGILMEIPADLSSHFRTPTVYTLDLGERTLVVYAGTKVLDGGVEQATLAVAVQDDATQDWLRGLNGQYPAPAKVRTLSIVDEADMRLTLVAEDSTFVFDLHTREWVKQARRKRTESRGEWAGPRSGWLGARAWELPGAGRRVAEEW